MSLRRFTQITRLAQQSSRRSITTSIPKPLAQPAFASATAPTDDNEMPAPVRTTAQWADFGREHVTNGLGRLRDHVIVKGEGMNLYTSEGEKLLDFTAGIGVTNLGHCHPAVSQAAAAQVNNLVHLQCSIAFHAPYLQLIDRLLPAMPHPSLDSFFFWNSGSEAVEAAMKLARKATGRTNLITFQGAYHGRTYGSGAMTRSKTIYTQGTGPLLGSIFCTAYPYWHSLGVAQGTSEEEIVRLAAFQLDMTLRQQVNPNEVAAIVIEPVQGEGGYVPCPPAFMRHLREVCDKHGIMLIVDEVQTGFYRTGKYFSIDHLADANGEAFKPDAMIMAKGLANGFPISGLVTRKELSDKLEPGSFGGTYAGNAVACAAGIAAQEVFQTEDIGGNVEARSAQLYDALNALATGEKTKHLISEVRGQGLMAAVEFRMASDPLTHTGLPAGTHIPANIGKRVQQYCIDHNLMVLTTSCFDTIRFIPALIVNEQEMKTALEIFTAAVEKVAREDPAGGVEASTFKRSEANEGSAA